MKLTFAKEMFYICLIMIAIALGVIAFAILTK